MSIFERFLTLWVALCIVAGVASMTPEHARTVASQGKAKAVMGIDATAEEKAEKAATRSVS